MLLTAAAVSAFAQSAALTPVSTRDRKIVQRWTLPSSARGIAAGGDGTLYVGIGKSQSILAIDSATGRITKKVVLDSTDIAATKEFVTLRTNADRSRLFVANGSDESAMILSLPDLTVLREITMEGETIRDAVPDPKGRYLYLLGRQVHVFDAEGQTELRTLNVTDPMAIAASSNGQLLAVFATEDFGNAKATVVAMFDPSGFKEVSRDPLQTEKSIEGATFADGDRALVAFSRDSLFEKRVQSSALMPMSRASSNGPMRMSIGYGDLVNSNRICLPSGSGPQAATLATPDNLLVYAERRCSASGTFSGSSRRVLPASLYGIDAYALAFDPSSGNIAATDLAGFLTIYRLPRPALAK